MAAPNPNPNPDPNPNPNPNPRPDPSPSPSPNPSPSLPLEQPAAAALVSARLAAEEPDCTIAEAWLGGADGTAALAAARALETQQARPPTEDPRAATLGGAGGAGHARHAGGGDAVRGADREARPGGGASTPSGALATGGTNGSSLPLAAARKAQRGGPSNKSETKGARWVAGRRKGAAATDWTI